MSDVPLRWPAGAGVLGSGISETMTEDRINKAYAEQIKPRLLGKYLPAITLLTT